MLCPLEMADIKQELKGVDDQQNYSVGNNTDPKNMQELTQYVQTLLQGMQDKFQTMSDQIITRKTWPVIFSMCLLIKMTDSGVAHVYTNSSLLSGILAIATGIIYLNDILLMSGSVESLKGAEFLFKSTDEMGNRIDDLEKNIADLMTQAGVEGPDK